MVNLLEVEKKVLEVGHMDLERRILSLGGNKVFDGNLIAVRLDKNHKYAIGSSELIRIRDEGGEVKITYKLKHSNHSNQNVNVCEETEVSVLNSFDETIELFQKLGYSIIEETKKRRVSYMLTSTLKLDFDNYLDDLTYIPEFLEIESKAQDPVRDINLAISMLGIENKNCDTYGLGDLKNLYGRN